MSEMSCNATPRIAATLIPMTAGATIAIRRGKGRTATMTEGAMTALPLTLVIATAWPWVKRIVEKARLFGIVGGYEAVSVWEDANNPVDSPTKDRANQIIKELAPNIDCQEVGLKNLLNEIALDPYVQFIRECWGSNVILPR